LTTPNYEILIEGKPRKIELSKTAQGSFTAKIGDKTHTIELNADKLIFEKEFEVRVDGKPYTVELPKIEREKLVPVKVEKATFKVQVRNSRMQVTTTSPPTFQPALQTPSRRVQTSKQAEAVEGAVTAPMTGKIVSIKVKKGDQVKLNQILCIIEAMKMENEITATKGGTVQEVNVTDGSPVSEGDTLVVIG
jgi:biotin carboxyl carrier protein